MEMDVSIVIPSKNGIKTIERCLQAIKSQRTAHVYEIILVDSGSSDETMSIAKKYGCKIIKILPQEFSHGYSRNLGADNATGKILVFLNQDAIPLNELWMDMLVSSIDDTCVAAFSKQVPYSDTHVVERVFLNRIYSDIPRTITKESLKKRNMKNSVIFSTVSAAIKKEIFTKFKFSEKIIMSEDQEFAIRLTREGYTIKYVPDSMVTHSHSYSISEVFKRYFDSGKSLHSISDLPPFSIRDIISEEYSILFESFQSSKTKPLESIFSIIYMLSKSIGFALGTKSNLLPKSLQNTFSHTLKLKQE